MQPKAAHGPGNEAIWLHVHSFFSPQTWPRPYSCRQVSIFPFVTVFEKEGNRERVGGWWTGEGGGSEREGSEGGGGEWGRGEGVKRGRERKGWKWEGRDGGGRGEGGREGREYVVCMQEVRQDVKYAFITAPYHVVSAPGPNQPQRGSCPILEAIRAGVGLGLWSRLLYHDDIMPVLVLDVFQVWNIWHRQCIHKRSFMNGSTSPPTTPSLQAHARGSHANKHRSHSCDRARSTRILRYSAGRGGVATHFSVYYCKVNDQSLKISAGNSQSLENQRGQWSSRAKKFWPAVAAVTAESMDVTSPLPMQVPGSHIWFLPTPMPCPWRQQKSDSETGKTRLPVSCA